MNIFNHEKLRAAQEKAVRAFRMHDGKMWMEANEDMKRAVGMPWYRREHEGSKPVLPV
ncbi:TPA: host cell division inhibitory peptide Kil [Escherichia coli]|nr:host cell division inhibitory peptide Kil [Escherichia coli]HEL8385951.1 host cell division inhibitory peptide Kil [Escherichia coli]HEM0058808.1 host cell division inhibitory peptide Kil [Escherichia coli]HEM0087233.1 host cell division inhibitory peptide Kil [Escherichia coli]